MICNRNSGTHPECYQHDWEVTPAQAIAVQKRLRTQVILQDDFDTVTTVAGVDVGFDKKTNTGRAALAVLRLDDLQLIESVQKESPLRFPYIPGLLSFREIPVIMEALAVLRNQPDLLLCDGQGTAHPRRFGIACHLGLLTNIPAIGVAKTRLLGEHGEVPNVKGGWTELYNNGEIIGAVLRTRKDVKPLYISPGHRISLTTSITYVMKCITRYKLPETTRLAHNLSLISRKRGSQA